MFGLTIFCQKNNLIIFCWQKLFHKFKELYERSLQFDNQNDDLFISEFPLIDNIYSYLQNNLKMVCTKLWYLMKCRPHSLKIQTYGKKIYPTMGQLSIIGNSLQVASNIYIFIRILFSFLHQKEKQVIWFSKIFLFI
jgi:hypothetical protein